MTGLKKAGVIAAMVLGALVISAAIVMGRDAFTTGTAQPAQQMPWDVKTLPGGSSQVLGLTLATMAAAPASGATDVKPSTLADAQHRWSSDFQMAVIAAPGETGTLEAYVESASIGPITGRLVLTAHATDAQIQLFREHAVKAEFMESTTRKYVLSTADQVMALQAPIIAVGFIPSAHLDAATIEARFGAPAQKLSGQTNLEYWLYPDKGLSVTIDHKGKELLQYVAPAEFDRLRKPLQNIKPAS